MVTRLAAYVSWPPFLPRLESERARYAEKARPVSERVESCRILLVMREFTHDSYCVNVHKKIMPVMKFGANCMK